MLLPFILITKELETIYGSYKSIHKYVMFSPSEHVGGLTSPCRTQV